MATFEKQKKSFVPEMVGAWAKISPNAVALEDGRETVTFLELEQRAGVMAEALRNLGVGREVVVGICAQRSVGLVIAELSVMKAGGAYMPLDPAYPQDRLNFQLADAQAQLLIVSSDDDGKFSGNSIKKLHLDLIGSAEAVENNPQTAAVGIDGEDLAYVIYTSGSTGRPKGVEITHGSLQNLVEWYKRNFGLTERDRTSHLAAVGFDAAVWELWPALCAGVRVAIADKNVAKDPKELRDWLLEKEITVSWVPTPMAERLMTMEWPRETKLRVMTTAGDALHAYPPGSLPFALVNNYGPTETTVCATSGTVPKGVRNAALPAIGWPIQDTQIYIVDEHLQEVAPGQEGEILIGGRGVARGYRNRPELTAEKFIANTLRPEAGGKLYRSGDRGCLLADGQIAFKGRVDEQIKIRGVRIEPGEIEAVLKEHPEVAECAVVAREFGADDKRLVAYLEIGQAESLTAVELRTALLERLPESMVPAVFLVVEQIPLNSSGKIDRRALPEPDLANMLRDEPAEKPGSATEEKLAEITRELLKVAAVGPQDDFFVLGGHSLLAAQLLARVRAEFGVEIGLHFLFDHPTIAELASEVERMSPSEALR